jgi:pimeloyl-ACP methyl ester carboxylesterase
VAREAPPPVGDDGGDDVHDDWGERSERWAGIRSETIDVRRTAVHALRSGDDVEGTPQLFVHGLGGNATNWIEVLQGFAEDGPVLAPDLPGFGRTEPPVPGASRVQSNARFLVALLDELEYDRVVVHGNSMGGLLSVLLAEIAPDRIERLVLVSPALPTRRRKVREMDRLAFRHFAPFFLPGVGSAVMRRMWATMTNEQLWEEQLGFIHGDSSRLSPEICELGIANLNYGRETPWRLPGYVAAAESLVSALLNSGDVSRAIDAIQAPTLLVWGDRDRLVGWPVIEHTRQQRPDWSLEIMETVGHAAMVEDPNGYLEVVRRWSRLTAHEGRAA